MYTYEVEWESDSWSSTSEEYSEDNFYSADDVREYDSMSSESRSVAQAKDAALREAAAAAEERARRKALSRTSGKKKTSALSKKESHSETGVKPTSLYPAGSASGTGKTTILPAVAVTDPVTFQAAGGGAAVMVSTPATADASADNHAHSHDHSAHASRHTAAQKGKRVAEEISWSSSDDELDTEEVEAVFPANVRAERARQKAASVSSFDTQDTRYPESIGTSRYTGSLAEEAAFAGDAEAEEADYLLQLTPWRKVASLPAPKEHLDTRPIIETLSEEEVELVEELRALIATTDEYAAYCHYHTTTPTTPFFVNDLNLVRNLRARDWDVEKAAELLAGTLEWRARMDPYNLICDSCLENPNAHNMRVVGYDKHNRPVVLSRFAQENKNTEDSIHHVIVTNETALRCMGPGVTQWTMVVDFSDFGISTINLGVAKHAGEIFGRLYPECLGEVLMLNPPWVFDGMWRIIKAFMPQNTVDKVHFLYGKQKEEYMQDLFDEELREDIAMYLS